MIERITCAQNNISCKPPHFPADSFHFNFFITKVIHDLHKTVNNEKFIKWKLLSRSPTPLLHFWKKSQRCVRPSTPPTTCSQNGNQTYHFAFFTLPSILAISVSPAFYSLDAVTEFHCMISHILSIFPLDIYSIQIFKEWTSLYITLCIILLLNTFKLPSKSGKKKMFHCFNLHFFEN